MQIRGILSHAIQKEVSAAEVAHFDLLKRSEVIVLGQIIIPAVSEYKKLKMTRYITLQKFLCLTSVTYEN